MIQLSRLFTIDVVSSLYEFVFTRYKSAKMIQWLQQWYADNCNGEWERSYGIAIGTINNPGWAVSIDLTNTKLNGIVVPDHFSETSAKDWMGYSITENVFEGVGDPSKLEKIIAVFKEICEAHGS